MLMGHAHGITSGALKNLHSDTVVKQRCGTCEVLQLSARLAASKICVGRELVGRQGA